MCHSDEFVSAAFNNCHILCHILLHFAESCDNILDLFVKFGTLPEQFGGALRVLSDEMTHHVHLRTDFLEFLGRESHAIEEIL